MSDLMVNRYDPDIDGIMELDNSGDYVEYEDYVAKTTQMETRILADAAKIKAADELADAAEEHIMSHGVTWIRTHNALAAYRKATQ